MAKAAEKDKSFRRPLFVIDVEESEACPFSSSSGKMCPSPDATALLVLFIVTLVVTGVVLLVCTMFDCTTLMTVAKIGCSVEGRWTSEAVDIGVSFDHDGLTLGGEGVDTEES